MPTAALPLEARLTASSALGHADKSRTLDVLLAACALHDVEHRQQRIRALLEFPISWTKVIALAQSHGLMPILYRNMSHGAGIIPEEALRELHARYERHARQALSLTQLLHEILAHLELRDVEAIPIKGPALAEALYHNIAMRQYSDLDILVRPEDVVRARAALESLGYTNELILTNAQQRSYLDSGYEYAFDGAYGKGVIELQWRILPRFYAADFDTQRLFAESGSGTVAGRHVRTLCAEDLLLVLCVHAAKHVWERLAWTRDVAEFTGSQAVDWEDVRRRAERMGIVRILGITLVLSRDLFGATIPPKMENMLSGDRLIAPLAATIRQSILSSVEYDTESVGYVRLMLRLRERRVDRVRFLARLAFTPGIGEWSAARLPDALFPLYRVVRIWRVLRRLLTGRHRSTFAADPVPQD